MRAELRAVGNGRSTCSESSPMFRSGAVLIVQLAACIGTALRRLGKIALGAFGFVLGSAISAASTWSCYAVLRCCCPIEAANEIEQA
jgi:hypothetical protein